MDASVGIFQTKERDLIVMFSMKLIKYINYLKDLDKKVLIASHTDGSSERLGSVLADHGLVIPEIKLGSEALAINKSKVYRIKIAIRNRL